MTSVTFSEKSSCLNEGISISNNSLKLVRVMTSLVCTEGCGQVLSSAKSLAAHVSRCRGRICWKGCGKVFASAQSCKVHSLSCSGTLRSRHFGQSFECPRGCGKTFTTLFSSKRHGVVCTRSSENSPRAATPQCSRCGSVFSRSDALKRHLRICGVTFKCSRGCGAELKTERRRAIHEADCRYKPRRYWCPRCPYKGYVHLQHYEIHRKKCSDEAPLPSPAI